jgi:hypothetical protein
MRAFRDDPAGFSYLASDYKRHKRALLVVDIGAIIGGIPAMKANLKRAKVPALYSQPTWQATA